VAETKDFYKPEPAGNQDSKPPGREQLNELETQANSYNSSSTSGSSSSYSSNGVKYKPSQAGSNTAGDEVSYSQEQPDDESSFFRGSSTKPGNKGRFSNLLIGRRRKAIFGSGLLGVIVGTVFFFSYSAGPLQFVHISQLMQRLHFASVNNAEDDRFMHEVRWLRYASQGKAERARMGYLGNYFTDNFETRMAEKTGLKPHYNRGVFVGYEVDTESEKSPYHGLSNQEAIDEIESKTGIKGVASYDGTLDQKLKGRAIVRLPIGVKGYFTSQKFDFMVMSDNGTHWIPAAAGARAMAVRRAASLHPLSKLVQGSKESYVALRERVKADEEKARANGTTPDESITAREQTPETVTGVEETNAVIEEASKDPVKTASKINLKLAGGTAAAGTFALGIACTLRHIDSQAGQIKDAQVVAPAIRIGVEAVATGDQVKSKQDVNLLALRAASEQLNGVTGDKGQKSSWYDAQSIQAELGHPGTGITPSPTLTDAGTAKTPFGVLNRPGSIQNTILGKTCGGAIGLALTIAGFATQTVGGFITTIAQTIITNQLAGEAANWLAGKALNLTPVGADYGNTLNFGSFFAANDEAIGAGGRALSQDETQQTAALTNSVDQNDFNNHSLAYKLFDREDQRTLLSKMVDHTSPSPVQNFASLGASIFKVGHSFGTIIASILPHAKAASASYNYGVPRYGFSVAELADPRLENPFENACHVVGCPAKNIDGFMVGSNNELTAAGQKYHDWALKCLGADISKTDSGQWNVVSAKSSPVYKYLLDPHSGCNDTSDFNHVRLRFFILDTETMNSMACYNGEASDDEANQACNDIGFGGSLQSDATTGSQPASGTSSTLDAAAIAKQILGNSKIILGGTYSRADVEAAANNKPGSAGVKTSAAILNLILQAGAQHSVAVIAIQSGGTGHCLKNGIPTPKSGCPNDPHYNGDAVDFEQFDGVDLSGRDKNSDALIQLAETVLPTGSRFGQQNCLGAGNQPVTLQTGFTQFDDACNHLHVDVPKGTP
jgi:hypothetical protein